MGKRKNKGLNNRNKKILAWIIGIIIVILAGILGFNTPEIQNLVKQLGIENTEIVSNSDTENQTTNSGNEINKENTAKGINLNNQENLKIYFIDVGQADSILVSNKEHNMLIDAGNNEDGEMVVDFVKNKGIEKLDYLIGTHPHEDHIGGLDDVINSDIKIENILMPKMQTNTKTFEDVLDAIQNKGLKVTAPKKGDKLTLGDANIEIMTDSIINKDNINLSSITLQLQYGNNKFLFMGDAEKENEETIEWKNIDLLKVGHHGSKTSSSTKFLSQTKPKISIIMAEEGNSYGLPKQEILERLEKVGSTIYRTDKNGTITVTSNGQKITVETEK